MKKTLMITALASGMALSGCATDPVTGQQTLNKGVVGAVVGAVAGAGISKATGGEERGRDAAIGAALGGAVGLYMENQEKKLQEQMAGTGVTVERDETTGDIDLVMPGNITFATDDTTIDAEFYSTLNKLAATLLEFNQTTVNVMGHTDSSGSAAYNQNLSEGRSLAVANYLVTKGLPAGRINTIGYGETRPLKPNDTAANKQENRRVEIKINAPKNVS